MERVVGLFHSPWESDIARLRASRNPLQMFRYAVWFKANPRDAAYMQKLFGERFPGAEFVDADRQPDWRNAVAGADTLVLLYPDAIGLGYSSLERKIGRIKKVTAAVRVLNGRRRDFTLDRATLRALRVRRCIEHLMLGEVLFVPVFLCLTPILLLIDWAQGRR
jgi:hypothetical protein